MSSELVKPVLMNYVKQKNYRDWKTSESAQEKAIRKILDKVRYITNKKLPKIKSKIDDIKAQRKKSGSKSK